MNDELIAVHAPSKIYDRARLVDFPPSPLNIISSGLSICDALSIGFDVIRSRRRRQSAISFADFAKAQFGEILARRVLLNYSEKLWGLPADQLSADIATRRLGGMTLRSLLLELFLARRTTTHIDGSFLYPKRGYGRIIERLSETLPKDSIRTDHEALALDCEHRRVSQVRFRDRSPLGLSGRLVSTLPISVLVKLLGDQLPAEVHAAAARLRFRQIRLFFVRLSQTRVSSNASFYIPDPEFCMSRVYEPKSRSRWMAPEHETSLVVEVPCFEGDRLYSIDVESLAAQVISELAKIGIIKPANVIEWRHHLLPNAYPVYCLEYGDAVRIVREALAKIENLDLIGRGGLFFYSHLHDQLRLAKNYINLRSRLRAHPSTDS